MPPPYIKREWVFLTSLMLFIVSVFVLFYKLIAPFFAPIAWAIILVITFNPAHQWLAQRVRPRGLAALISTVAVALLILGPAIWLVATLVGEAQELYQWVEAGGWTGGAVLDDLATRVNPTLRSLGEKLDGLVDVTNWDVRSIISDFMRKFTRWIVDHTASTLANLGKFILQFLMMLLTMYYLFKEGAPFFEGMRASIPLPDDRAKSIMAHTIEVVRATIYGGLVVAAIQGVLGGILFLAVGLPSPVLWGAVMGFFALIPLLGAFVVYIPAGIFLLASGAYVKAIVLLALGVGVVSQIDNVLRPLLISGRTQLHPLLLFFSIAGGVSTFGFLGLVLGPVIAALFVALLEVYRMAIRAGEFT